MQKNGNYYARTEEEWGIITKIFEEADQDIKWGGVEKPTTFSDWNEHKETSIIVLRNSVLTYGFIENTDLPCFELSASKKTFEEVDCRFGC